MDTIDLDASSARLGQTTFVGHGGRDDPDDPFDRAVCDIAGHVAEVIRGGSRDLTDLIDLVVGNQRADEDTYRARSCMAEVAGEDDENRRKFIE